MLVPCPATKPASSNADEKYSPPGLLPQTGHRLVPMSASATGIAGHGT